MDHRHHHSDQRKQFFVDHNPSLWKVTMRNDQRKVHKRKSILVSDQIYLMMKVFFFILNICNFLQVLQWQHLYFSSMFRISMCSFVPAIPNYLQEPASFVQAVCILNRGQTGDWSRFIINVNLETVGG